MVVVSKIPTSVVVHPLVLLGVVDHYNRVCKDTNKRAVGVLLGSISQGKVSCTNSFAVPFEEEEQDSSVWFLDHNFLESMWAMFRKVNAREYIVGWYSTGPKIRPADLDVNELFRRYCSNPVLVIVDVEPKEDGIPTQAYISVEDPVEDNKSTDDKGARVRTFRHLPSELGSADAEQVGIGHLLRDVKDATIATLSDDLKSKVLSLNSLESRLKDIQMYLKSVIDGELPLNHEILYAIQEIFNVLPTLFTPEVMKAFLIETNDIMLVLYLASLIRSIIALNDLSNNKLSLREGEKKAADMLQEKRTKLQLKQHESDLATAKNRKK
ncbi:26S proteasome regulatory subunit N8 [Galdieria sulphuraria]|uniref:26S proteasome regulatory subunit N8 n=1 Tax=Galdieria sulphuraria TaxID=130081 RepID=M2Y8F5_GALSU|nr:26S proteasome regulatory subunit N8 [Galdieria sulphuraria]EME32333.1 26S proteasome regulatory subunit N8 [Galdieria sulphuraria]|eukprot:XP_005708853.1 26S proteasome regulatory subunit N8 [Galdieria sulphuraria]